MTASWLRRTLCLLVVLMAGQVPPGVGAQSQATAPALTKAEWRDDLKYFARELAKRHKNLYHATSREQFERAITDLDAAISSLQDHQIIVKLHQIAASVGDGHTGVHVPAFFKRYPINVYWFGRELRVIAAAKEYQNALGARIVKIGNLDIDEAAARVATCFPSKDNENEWYVMSTSPAFLVRPEILHALGIVPDLSRAAFTLEDDAGRRSAVEISPVAVPPAVNGTVNIGMVPIVSEPPLFRQKLGEPFWFAYLQDSGTTYVNFKRYPSLKQGAGALFSAVDRNRPERLVIDLRQNGGGDYFVGREHLIEPIKKRPAINQKGRLFVVIGRSTFSAAMVNAIDFRKQTNAILVGEPIGERPNSYSENDEMTLPHSRLVVSYSTRYYKFVEEDVPAVMPDERIDATWADFRAGRDAVMDWILARPVSR
jgi:hypothetical protein